METREESGSMAESLESGRRAISEAAEAAASKAAEVTSQLGQKVRAVAGKLRERSPHETVRDATYKVADTLESAGAYLESKSLRDIADDLGAVVRRYPLQSLLLGVALGFLLARRR